MSSPGAPIAGTGEAGRNLTRLLNENLAEYATQSQYAGRIGFFGVLADWQDVNGTMAELDFLYTPAMAASSSATLCSSPFG